MERQRYLLAITMNSIESALVLFLLFSFDSKFEVVIISFLTLIYYAIANGIHSISTMIIETTHHHDEQTSKIYALLNSPESGSYRESLIEEKKDLDKHRSRYLLDIYFRAFTIIIATIRIIQVLLF